MFSAVFLCSPFFNSSLPFTAICSPNEMKEEAEEEEEACRTLRPLFEETLAAPSAMLLDVSFGPGAEKNHGESSVF